MSEKKVIANMRHMAWERAKGELRSMPCTFWGDNDDEQYSILSKKIEEFIKDIQSNGWHD